MTFFSNMTTDGLEKEGDRLGGGNFGLWDTGAYDGVVKMAYLDKYDSGAQYIDLTLSKGGKDFRQKVLITNSKGENFYTKDGKKNPLMGFSLMDSLCVMLTGMPLAGQDGEVEEKAVEVFNYTTKQTEKVAKPVLMALLNKPVTFAIEKSLNNKQVKDQSTGKYENTAETEEKNELVKFFDTETKLTLTEAEGGLEEGQFYHKWLAANTDENGVGKIRNKVKPVAPGAPVSGKPPVAGAPAAGAAPKKALFGKKA